MYLFDSFLSSPIYVTVHLLGLIAALDALFQTRSSQGAIAWFLSLILFPFVLLPVYLVFGRPRLRGYKKLVRKMIANAQKSNLPKRNLSSTTHHDSEVRSTVAHTLENIACRHFTDGNEVTLLVDGPAFFSSLLDDIRQAKSHIGLCFYIVRNDRIGKEVQRELLAAVRRGVTVWFLYDKIGSLEMDDEFASELEEGGVQLIDFHTRRGWWNLFQINSRNHRKIVVVDHAIAHVGGFNIGDEYLGNSEELGHWRDTQVRIVGPEVRNIELIFLGDWAWATQERVEVPDVPIPAPCGEFSVLTLGTGCTDERDECLLFFLSLINGATKRLWIATPYFVPDESILQAINLAAIRGVDVKMIVPGKSDNVLTWLAALYYLPQISNVGVQVYRYDKGFLHQKVILVDDTMSAVGSANLDNRSLRLSFEIMNAIAGKTFAARMEEMLRNDLAHSTLIESTVFEKLPFRTRLGANLARLLSPIL